MNIHSLAKTTPLSRALIVKLVLQQGRSPGIVARDFHISVRTVYKWLARFRAAGQAGLLDRSNAPHTRPRQLAQEFVAEIIRLRWLKLTAQAIANRLGLARSTVGLWLRRLKLNRQRDLSEDTTDLFDHPVHLQHSHRRILGHQFAEQGLFFFREFKARHVSSRKPIDHLRGKHHVEVGPE